MNLLQAARQAVTALQAADSTLSNAEKEQKIQVGSEKEQNDKVNAIPIWKNNHSEAKKNGMKE